VEIGQRAALPAQCEVGRRLVAINREDHFLDEGSQKLLAVARCGRRRIPDRGEVGPQGEQALALLLAEDSGASLHAAGEFILRGLDVRQALLPLALEPTGDEPVVRVDRPITTLGSAGFKARAFDAQPPLLERRFAVGLEALRGGDGGGELSRLQCGEESLCDRLVDLHAAHAETITAAALDNGLARAMVSRGGVAPAVVRLQTPAAVAAVDQTLQERRALSHGAARLVRPRACVGGEPGLVGLVRWPIDEAFMVLLDQHLPHAEWQ